MTYLYVAMFTRKLELCGTWQHGNQSMQQGQALLHFVKGGLELLMTWMSQSSPIRLQENDRDQQRDQVSLREPAY